MPYTDGSDFISQYAICQPCPPLRRRAQYSGDARGAAAVEPRRADVPDGAGGTSVAAALQRLIVRISATGTWYVLVLALAVGSFTALMRIGAAFPAVAAGNAPFDLQNGLAAGDVYRQLSGWTPAARQLYFVFSAVDWIFPLAAGLFLAATVTFCLRTSAPRAYAWLTGRTLLPLLLAPTAFDWLENVFAVAAVATYPQGPAWLPAALVVAKRAKLAGLAVVQPLMFGLVLYTAGRWLISRRRTATPTPPPGPPAPPTGT
jgi:hypothetical protein